MKIKNDIRWIDIGTSIEPDLVVWPGDPKIAIEQLATVAKDGYNLTKISLSAHSGTHMDAPFHYLSKGKTIDQIDVNRLIGEVKVFQIDSKVVSAKDLMNLEIEEGDNIFLKTINSEQDWQNMPFLKDFVYIDESAARYLVEKKINMIGIDYLSIAHPENGVEVHRILLANEVVIVEGLRLKEINEGNYEMICLPMKIKGGDGAPVRVVLRGIGEIEV
jgi:arylformamidase